MQIQEDMSRTMRDGRVSWIFAFEDSHPFGPARTGGKKYSHVLHQVKEPLSSITSICTEPVFGGMLSFLQRHIPLNSSREENPQLSKACLEFWVQWHSFLTEMRFPTYKIEEVELQDIFQISGLGHLYLEEPLDISIKSNHRGHRPKFSWQELYTMDPLLAAKAWELAHYYGYSYPDVDFDSLTCLDYAPGCSRRRNVKTDKCPNGTHPYPTNMSSNIISPPAANHGFKGWVDSGCVEYRVPWSFPPYIGIRGLLGEDDLQNISRTLDKELFLQLNETMVSKRLLMNISASHMASSQSSQPSYGFRGHRFFILGLYFSVFIVLTRLCLNRRRRHKWQERGPRKLVFAKMPQAREQYE
mmetsp:Transcript_34056/g.55616  ORF Transcript_34056/g.55616 Transcript_34056/m.55616 type:complete len:357 (+) Transcript_34056:1-1071(+)